MSVSLSPPPTLQFFNNQGQMNAGGSVLTQVGGINAATYQDSAGATALPNPIPLNSRGEISNAAGATCQLFLTAGSIYTFTVYDAAGNQLDSFTYMVGAASSADISNLQSQITAFATSFTTGALTVTGTSTLGAVTCTSLTSSGAISGTTGTFSGAISAAGETLSGNLAMGGNSITGALNITATGTISAAAVSTTTPNAASFYTSGVTNSGTVVDFNGTGGASGSGITNSSGTITFANVGTYDVLFAGQLEQPTAAVNIDTGLYFGGTANLIVGPIGGNTQRVLIAGANGAVYAPITMRAIVVISAANQNITVSSMASFSSTYEATAGCWITIAQR